MSSANVKKKKNFTPCATDSCKNNSDGREFCGTCRRRKARESNPIKAAWENLHYSANKREIFFDLTLEEFTEFCYETEYMKGKGRKVGGYNVDRIIEGKLPGYTKSNIQCLDKQKNVKKYFDWASKKTVTQVTIEFPPEDLPF
jgi:hypothetical protein